MDFGTIGPGVGGRARGQSTSVSSLDYQTTIALLFIFHSQIRAFLDFISLFSMLVFIL